MDEEPVPGENTWLETGFTLTDNVIAWAKANQMYVILELQAAPGGQSADPERSDYDDSKSSLWEDQANRDKTVALWQRLAETYADETTIAGYSLLNEPDVAADSDLKALYESITTAIRSVDANHVLFIQGNDFGVNFGGLTPAWDSKIVFASNKFATFNDQGSIQDLTNLRSSTNTPVFIERFADNSNAWFRDAVRLFENNGIGWSMSPLKRVGRTSAPFTWEKSDRYQRVLNFWLGTAPEPSPLTTNNALGDLTEGIRLENIFYAKDVVDAITRQRSSNAAVPYRRNVVPGRIIATEYDLGGPGIAYVDDSVANFENSTGNFTRWNNGLFFRNDGVDVEPSTDPTSNGYNIGWIKRDEWVQWTLDIQENGLYDIEVRFAANKDNGKFHLTMDDIDITEIVSVPFTGDWQNWQTILFEDVVLTTSDKKLKLIVDKAAVNAGSFNISSFNFVRVGNSTDVPVTALSAATESDDVSINLKLNKGIDPSSDFSGFVVTANGSAVNIVNVGLNPANSREIILEAGSLFSFEDEILLSYNGSGVVALDGTQLSVISNLPVENNVPVISTIPGRVQAEDFFEQSGIKVESTDDEGGGENIGFLDPGDQVSYYVNVTEADLYSVLYRTSAFTESGSLRMEIIEQSGNTLVHRADFPVTGGWEQYTNTPVTGEMPAGELEIRLTVIEGGFNINWFEFSNVTSIEGFEDGEVVQIFPNPADDQFSVQATFNTPRSVQVDVRNLLGKTLLTREIGTTTQVNESFNASGLSAGIYLVNIRSKSGEVVTRKLVIE